METIRKFDEPTSTVKDNTPAPTKIIRLYEPQPEAVTAEAEPVVAEGATEAVAEVAAPVITEGTEAPKAEEKLSRRDAFKRAAELERKAQEKEKLANQKLAKVQEFQQFYEKAKQDPTEIARAFGMDPTEFLRQYQNQMFNIKEEPAKKAELTAEQVTQQRLERLEQERMAQQAAAEAKQYNETKTGYISNTILPVIGKDLEKFQMINAEGEQARNQWAAYLYDIMDNHYRSTGGHNGGEVLDINALAETLEENLTKDAEDKLAKAQKLSRFAKRFRSEAEVKPEVKTGIKTLSASIGKTATGGLPTTVKKDEDGRKIYQVDYVSGKEAKKEATKEWLRNQRKSG